ncbi:MAG: hypothetical protein SPF26_01025 [Succinivibrio sp.]|nr:hypothetical protein [Succinivibrio sp.]MDY5188053.1 hypothetical protein [Succinivibrio sp.]MDY5324037.1 hypothetical protein [Succinivibrio sp.]
MTDLKFSSIREALHFRMTVSEDHYFDVEYFDVLLDLCLKDFKSTMDFVSNEITDEELYYFNEIVQFILEKDPNMDFLTRYKDRVNLVKNEEERAELLEDIKDYYGYFPPEIQQSLKKC